MYNRNLVLQLFNQANATPSPEGKIHFLKSALFVIGDYPDLELLINIYCSLGDSYLGMNQHSLALIAYQIALEMLTYLRPDQTDNHALFELHRDLGDSYFKLGYYMEATTVYQNALALHLPKEGAPIDSDNLVHVSDRLNMSYFYLYKFHCQSGDRFFHQTAYPKALVEYQHAWRYLSSLQAFDLRAKNEVELHINFSNTFLQLGYLDISVNALEEAISAFQRIPKKNEQEQQLGKIHDISINPQSFRDHFNRYLLPCYFQSPTYKADSQLLLDHYFLKYLNDEFQKLNVQASVGNQSLFHHSAHRLSQNSQAKERDATVMRKQGSNG